MTRWQKFGLALGYTLLTLFGVFTWITGMNAFHYLGASSLIYGLGVGAYSDHPWIGHLSFINFLLIGAGLIIVPILAAFRLRKPLYGLMTLDVLGRILLLANKWVDKDPYALGHVFAGLLVSVAVLAATIHCLRQPDVTPEAQVR